MGVETGGKATGAPINIGAQGDYVCPEFAERYSLEPKMKRKPSTVWDIEAEPMTFNNGSIHANGREKPRTSSTSSTQVQGKPSWEYLGYDDGILRLTRRLAISNGIKLVRKGPKSDLSRSPQLREIVACVRGSKSGPSERPKVHENSSISQQKRRTQRWLLGTCRTHSFTQQKEAELHQEHQRSASTTILIGRTQQHRLLPKTSLAPLSID